MRPSLVRDDSRAQALKNWEKLFIKPVPASESPEQTSKRLEKQAVEKIPNTDHHNRHESSHLLSTLTYGPDGAGTDSRLKKEVRLHPNIAKASLIEQSWLRNNTELRSVIITHAKNGLFETACGCFVEAYNLRCQCLSYLVKSSGVIVEYGCRTKFFLIKLDASIFKAPVAKPKVEKFIPQLEAAEARRIAKAETLSEIDSVPRKYQGQYKGPVYTDKEFSKALFSGKVWAPKCTDLQYQLWVDYQFKSTDKLPVKSGSDKSVRHAVRPSIRVIRSYDDTYAPSPELDYEDPNFKD